MLEFFTDSIHTARKPHECQLCGTEIPAGTKYHRQSGKWDGEFFDRCLHVTCDSIISEYCTKNQEEEYSPDWIAGWLADKYCNGCAKEEQCDHGVFTCPMIIKEFKEAEKDV